MQDSARPRRARPAPVEGDSDGEDVVIDLERLNDDE